MRKSDRILSSLSLWSLETKLCIEFVPNTEDVQSYQTRDPIDSQSNDSQIVSEIFLLLFIINKQNFLFNLFLNNKID
jgi:hypothetical protein